MLGICLLVDQTFSYVLKAICNFFLTRRSQPTATTLTKNNSLCWDRINSDVHISRLYENREIIPNRVLYFSFRSFNSDNKEQSNPFDDHELYIFSVIAIVSPTGCRKLLTLKNKKSDLTCLRILM